MSEIKVPVSTVEINYICDDCKTGILKPTGIILTTYPPKYPHKCSNCNTEKTFLITYPYYSHHPED